MIGQPIDKLIEHLNNQDEYIRSLREQKPPKTEKPVDINEELEAVELMELEPKDQAKAILKIAQKALKESEEYKALKAENERLKEQIQPIQEQEVLKTFYQDISKHPDLPQGSDPQDALNDWKENSGLSKDDMLVLSYSPRLLVDNIAKFAKSKADLKSKEDEEKETKRKSKIKIANEVKKKLKEASTLKTKGSSFNAAPKETAVYMDKGTDQRARKILERNGLL